MSDIELTINKKYAEQFERKKKKEELAQRKCILILVQEKYGGSASGSEEESSTSEEEDENGELLTPEIDARILKAISKIRSQDKTVYDPSESFFNDKDFEDIHISATSKSAPMHLKDYQRKKLLEEHQARQSEDIEYQPASHFEEQEMLKNELKSAFSVATEGEEDFLKKKSKSSEDLEREENEYKEFLLMNLAKEESCKESMMEWFAASSKKKSKKANISKDDQFLIDYVLNRGWVDKETLAASHGNSINDEEDEEEVEKMEEFELKHNFRFEQEGGTSLVTHARDIKGSVRRKDDSRKLAREARKERKEEEKRKKQEELKRLKNLKAGEIKEKLKKLKNVSKAEDKKLESIDVDSDFDPEKHDKQMAAIFDEEYYDVKEHKPEVDEEFEEEMQLIEKKFPKEEFKRQKPDKQVNEIMDEYYQLDYEDLVAGIPCRFKYRSVRPTSFGLSVEDILQSEDKSLNEFVSLKKLAPYRPPDKEEADIRRLSKKKRLRAFYESQNEAAGPNTRKK